MGYSNDKHTHAEELPDIIVAAYAGDVTKVKQLLAEGVSPNTVDQRDNLTMLHIAGLQGDERLADALIEHDKMHGNVDFAVRSSFRPRLAWQFAANADFLDLASTIHRIGLRKKRTKPRITP